MTYFPLAQDKGVARFNGLPAVGVVLTTEEARYHTAALRYPNAEEHDRPWCACSLSRTFGGLDPGASRQGCSLIMLPPGVDTVHVRAGVFSVKKDVAVQD